MTFCYETYLKFIVNGFACLNSPKAGKKKQITLTCTDNTKWLIRGKPIIQSTYAPHHAKSLLTVYDVQHIIIRS